MKYDTDLYEFGDLMTVKDFLECCEQTLFTDYDGSGHPVKDGKMMREFNVYPSKRKDIPADATHIMWFNK